MAHNMGSRWHQAIMDVLHGVNFCQPAQLPELLSSALAQVPATATLYLVDHEQEWLHPLPCGPGALAEALPVEASVAGRAYCLGQTIPGTAEDGMERLWVPLLDGSERLGVMELTVPAAASGGDLDMQPHVAVANLMGHLIAAKLPYGDRLEQYRRTRPMSAASELLWRMLPPHTFTCAELVISATLCPPYTAGGDAFDYAVDAGTAHVAIFDGTGRGMYAGLGTAVALAATRAARRAGSKVDTMAAAADTELAAQFSDCRFATAILAQLDLGTGILSYINAGHPEPVVLRGTNAVRTLSEGRRLPLGLGSLAGVAVASIAQEALEPGDRVLLYTDGVIEARSPDGELFGRDRLVDLATRYAIDHLSAPEATRRLTEAVIGHLGGPPTDDATLLIMEWSPGAAAKTLP